MFVGTPPYSNSIQPQGSVPVDMQQRDSLTIKLNKLANRLFEIEQTHSALRNRFISETPSLHPSGLAEPNIVPTVPTLYSTLDFIDKTVRDIESHTHALAEII